MKNQYTLNAIKISGINLWAHVGVLADERRLGQAFNLDLVLWVDIKKAVIDDELSSTLDYALAVKSIQELAFEINCKTIERFSECILDTLESVYGQIPIEISLTKCSPPIEGFEGSVSIKRNRNIVT